MIRNQDIICISTIDWNFIWQAHQEIMSRLARNGNRVLFIENTGVRAPGIRDISRLKNRIINWRKGVSGIRKERENLYIYAPLVLPFPYLRPAMWINHRLVVAKLRAWTKVMKFNNPVIWVFLPTPLSLAIINNIENKGVVYYCCDNFRIGTAVTKKITASESKLLDSSDLVFATSLELYRYCLARNKETYRFPCAIDFEEFEKYSGVKTPLPEDIRSLPHPVVGYVGGVHKWVDAQLIAEAAKKLSQCSFVLIGPVQSDVSCLKGLNNVHLLGMRDHESIPAYINSFDVCIIPYRITEYTRNVYPTKMNEYLAMGKSVVSTDLPEVKEFNSLNSEPVLVASGAPEFCECIERVLSRDSGGLDAKARIDVARRNGWSVRLDEMCALLESKIINRDLPEIDWQERVRRFYKSSFQGMFRLFFFAAVLYAIVFYTPLMWGLAEPLKISSSPRKSDCIVVFGGGVGESGKATQGYQERVRYAVELYKKGLAGNIIFSSGYVYVFKEAFIMKSLAVSLGVPEDAIILEERSTNTYEKVLYAKELFNERGWRKALFVSSPYHMLRLFLVAKKQASGIEVSYMPIPESQFYSHDSDGWGSRRISPHQIGGIVHEYLGIVYYFFKGFI